MMDVQHVITMASSGTENEPRDDDFSYAIEPERSDAGDGV